MNRNSKKKGRRFLSMLLVLAVWLSGKGMSAFARGVNENDVSLDESQVPQNPVHYCNPENSEEDTTEWSYVYFGSYPQSEVTDEGIQKEIDAAITVSGNLADAGMDVWVNGTKYRRISKTDTNYSGYFDEVSNNGYRYFKWERIKWKVLNNDENTLFVVADRAIDCKEYNEEYESITWENITWENSAIRNWLNSSFYSTAFSSSEQVAIVTQNVVNEDNPSYGTEGGNNTSDNIYLLSISEATNETYGFCSDHNTYSASRWVQPSNYAHARGTYTYSGSYTGGNDNCWWWLRSPSGNGFGAANGGSYGYVDRGGPPVNYDNDGVCPALHINLSSGIWSMADYGTSGEGGNGITKTTTITITVRAKNGGNTQNPEGNTSQPGKDTSQSDGNTQNQPIEVTELTITAPSKKLAEDKKVKLTLKAEPENAWDKTGRGSQSTLIRP